MSAKFLCLIACTLLFATLLSNVNAQLCYNSKNATTCSTCDSTNICGVATSTCCTTSDFTYIQNTDNTFDSYKFSATCRKFVSQELCAKCSPTNAVNVNPDGSVKLCKTYCLAKKSACDQYFEAQNLKIVDCTTATTDTNCFNSGVINQISGLAMICLAVILSVFAL